MQPFVDLHHCTLALGQIEPAPVRGDRDALHRVLLNLLENAVLHGGDGIRIDIEGHCATAGYELLVRDSGRGIPSDHQPRIFERFYRIDHSRSRARGGSGLGLALVKHIVQEHGGAIELESVVGRGTTFRIWLPLANVTKPASAAGQTSLS
jgi:two-component system phosphate regulon sensor histidine kinase PhoR